MLAVLLLAAGALVARAKDLALVPWPQQVRQMDGSFMLTAQTRICADWPSRQTAAFFAERLRRSTGYPLKAHWRISAVAPLNSILFTTKGSDSKLGREGYELVVTTNGVVIRASAQAGLFYGGQTLLQLLSFGETPDDLVRTILLHHEPIRASCLGLRETALTPALSPGRGRIVVRWFDTANDDSGSGEEMTAPCVSITDWPRFPWRGFMLDVSRHYFNKAEVETILDEMAFYKLNRFHWHLVDDQGWRIEIPKYPRLTQIGAWRSQAQIEPSETNAPSADKFGPDGRYGGFYTPQDIRDVVAYAAVRHIVVVPEIEMPGHSEAALAAYPQFSCFGGPYSTDSNLSIHDSIYDPSNEGTFEFLDNVLLEVVRLFPGPYIHIGGDEVRRDYWNRSAACRALMKREGLASEDELQSYFIKRMERFVNGHGKILIGWSEISKGGLATNAVVMDWIGGGKQAAESGHEAVMTPIDYCYLDHYHKPDAPDIYTPLRKVYSFEPIPAGLPARFQSRILGAEGVLWTEYVASFPKAQQVIFPRECAIAEVTWSAPQDRDWNSFEGRIGERRFGPRPPGE